MRVALCLPDRTVGDGGWGCPGWLYAAEDIGDTPKKPPRKCRTAMGEDRAGDGARGVPNRLDYSSEPSMSVAGKKQWLKKEQ
jgi:hypothetical protein